MKGQRAAVRYARSFMQLAKEKSQLDVLKSDIESILLSIENSRELENFLNSPLIKIEKKKEILKSLFSGKVSELSLSFIIQIADHKREGLMKMICQEFIRQYNAEHNIATVNLTTATPLNEAQRKNILEFITSSYNFKSVVLDEKIDEDLIGGLVLRIDDKQIDGSIKRKLQDIKQELIHA